MTAQRRTRVTSPQTRIALARRHRGGQHLLRVPAPADTERARLVFLAQRRRAVGSMLLLALVLFGLSGLVAFVPALGELRVAQFPLSWLLVGVVAYPVLVTLAMWHVRAAERIERTAGPGGAVPGDPGGAGP
ncbi:hypothetical protein RIF23_15160 [Lipingzhangella sp. LS1_29]|uniref:Solute:sodium symporter small subunit n=1 Tax=Lipingzhangella rawalii TaxID=2055835 RepID=A0ABU2H8K3_9ACTN|nr:hypothetical protein [Lipingzhangella rawalii]MDS1271633.1 hypothetical protein [Lipingzhangella rawalii]